MYNHNQYPFQENLSCHSLGTSLIQISVLADLELPIISHLHVSIENFSCFLYQVQISTLSASRVGTTTNLPVAPKSLGRYGGLGGLSGPRALGGFGGIPKVRAIFIP